MSGKINCHALISIKGFEKRFFFSYCDHAVIATNKPVN